MHNIEFLTEPLKISAHSVATKLVLLLFSHKFPVLEAVSSLYAFYQKCMYVFLIAITHATYPTHLVYLDLITNDISWMNI
jgi:hypothetical protein